MKMKSLAAAAVIVLLLLVFILPRTSRTYEFSHAPEDIVSIELLTNSNKTGKADVENLVL